MKIKKILSLFLLLASINLLPSGLEASEALCPSDNQLFQATERIELIVPPEKQKHLSAFMPSATNTLNLVMMAGDFKHIEINGADVTVASAIEGGLADCRPAEGWKEGLNLVKVTVRNGDMDYHYVLYVSHYRQRIPKVVWNEQECSIDGVPFFPMGIYNVNEDDMPKIAQYDFNIIQNYDRTSHDVASLDANRRWFDAAKKNHLKVMWSLSRKDEREQNFGRIAEWVTSLMNHPALFCYYISDEPDLLGLSPEKMEKVNLLVKGLDPFHPTTMSTWKPAEYHSGADVDFRQCYQGHPALIARDFENYLRLSRSLGDATIAILNTHDHRNKADPDTTGNSPFYYFGESKRGTPEWKAAEQRGKLVAANLEKPPFPFYRDFPIGPCFRSDAYAAIAKGSPGLFWWWYQDSAKFKIYTDSWYTVFQYPPTEKVVRRTMAEIKSLSPLLMAPAIKSLSWETNGILFWSRCAQGTNILIAVNLTTNEVSGSFEMKNWGNGKTFAARVVGEDREVVIRGGKLQDEWKPEDTHVYVSSTK